MNQVCKELPQNFRNIVHPENLKDRFKIFRSWQSVDFFFKHSLRYGILTKLNMGKFQHLANTLRRDQSY